VVEIGGERRAEENSKTICSSQQPMKNMKTNPKILLLVMAVGALVGDQVFGQPTNMLPDFHVNPLTGLPGGTGSGVIDPATGLAQDAGSALPGDNSQPNSGGDLTLLLQAQVLSAKGQHDQALQCFLKLYAQAQAATNSALLKTVLPDWIELGKKYPKAKQALVDIRDQDTREFSQGKGDLPLLQEVADVNEALGDDQATVALFKNIGQKNPSQAKDWHMFIEPALVRCGEYQLCLDYIGNPQTRFKIYCYTFQRLQTLHEGMNELSREAKRKMEELSQQPGGPPLSPYPHVNPGKKGLRITKDNYVNEVRRLIEILVATGHQEEAEKIRGEAVAVLDDPRLQSAVSHAEAHIKNPETIPSSGAPMVDVLPPVAGSGAIINTTNGISEIAGGKPGVIAPSNQFFGPTIELTLNVNDNGLSDCLNLDYGTVVSLRELKLEAYFYARLPANGIAIFPPQQISQAALTPLKVVSKRTRLLQRPESDSGQAWNDTPPPAWLNLPAPQISDGMNLLYDQAQAYQGLPALFGFQTSLGNAGLLQITGFTEHPRSVTIRYKLLHNPDPPEIPDINASPEDWSPALAPGEKPDLMKLRFAIKKFLDQDRYEEALERQVWYFNHALQYGETDAIRLSFGVGNWEELGRRYPKAKLAMIKIRDRATREFSAAGNSAGLFPEIYTLNLLLHDDDATVALFKTIDRQDNKLASECYKDAEDVLARNGEYTLCMKYLGDPQAKFEIIRALWQTLLDASNPTDPHRKAAMDEIERINRANGVESPRLTGKKYAQEVFVWKIRALIETLVATGHRTDAEKIRDKAVLVLDDPRLRSAVSDAEQKIKK
jgi:hypothetical protein